MNYALWKFYWVLCVTTAYIELIKGMVMRKILMCFVLIIFCSSANANTQSIAEKIQVLKQQAVLLHKDLAQLEQDLIYPSSTQVSIYVAMNIEKGLTLGSLVLSIDDVVVARSVYNKDQNSALNLGGMQRLYLGNLSVGEHRFKVIVKAVDANDKVITLTGEAGYYKSSEPLSISLNLLGAKGVNPPILTLTRL